LLSLAATLAEIEKGGGEAAFTSGGAAVNAKKVEGHRCTGQMEDRRHQQG